MKKKHYLVSACLLGINCKFNGSNNYNPKVITFLKDKDFTPVCPEQLGGLSTPRIPAEIVGQKMINNEGDDVSTFFERGAKETLKIAELIGATHAIFKDGSPSCGTSRVRDGTFKQNSITGEGWTTTLLRRNKIKIINEKIKDDY